MKTLYSKLKTKVALAGTALLLTTSAIAQTDVLVCGAASPQSWLDDVQTKLIATGAFNSVATYNLYLTGTPTLAYLQGFDAVLVYTDYGPMDPVTFGNNLAQYIDGGGGVVNCTFSNASVLITGNFNTTTYQVIVPNNGQNSSPQLTLGAILDPCSPIMTGITSFDGGSSSYRSSSSTLAPGASFVANWSNGEWLVAKKENVGPANARRADLNFYPPSSTVRSDFWDAATQGGQLMANALLWVAGVTSASAPPATPGAVTGLGTICEGTSTTYSISSVSGATGYTWTVPAGSTISGGQGTTTITVVAGNTSGNVTVTADNTCGSSAPSTFALTINPMPTVSSTASPGTTVCDGTSVTLSGTGATSYTWTGGISDGVAFTATATTTYTVTGTDGNGCMNTATTTVTVNPLPTIGSTASPATTVCENTSVTLSGTGASSYTWTGVITDGVAFTATTTTTYTVTGTDANGCINTATETITVNPLPTVSSTASSTSICAGDSVILSGSGASTYSWTSSVVDGVAFAPSVTDTYTVTGTDANGCENSSSITVTVNALPVVSLGADVTQCGGTVMLDAQNAGSTYLWSDSAVTQVITVGMSGTYYVDVTDTNGCSSADTVMVTILDVPVVTFGGDIEQCGGTVLLDAQNAGSTYLWSDSTTAQTLTVTTSGTYYVTVTNSSNCTSSDTIDVTINTPPTVAGTASASSACADDANVTLTGTPAGGTWSGPGVSGSSFDPSVAGTGTHTVSYIFTDPNGCSDTATVTISVSPCVGVAEQTLDGNVNVFPNPNNGTFTLAIGAAAGDMTVEVVDLSGRQVYVSVEQNVQAGFTKQLSLDNAAAGIYLLRVTSGGQQYVQKISVQ